MGRRRSWWPSSVCSASWLRRAWEGRTFLFFIYFLEEEEGGERKRETRRGATKKCARREKKKVRQNVSFFAANITGFPPTNKLEFFIGDDKMSYSARLSVRGGSTGERRGTTTRGKSKHPKKIGERNERQGFHFRLRAFLGKHARDHVASLSVVLLSLTLPEELRVRERERERLFFAMVFLFCFVSSCCSCRKGKKDLKMVALSSSKNTSSSQKKNDVDVSDCSSQKEEESLLFPFSKTFFFPTSFVRPRSLPQPWGSSIGTKEREIHDSNAKRETGKD